MSPPCPRFRAPKDCAWPHRPVPCWKLHVGAKGNRQPPEERGLRPQSSHGHLCLLLRFFMTPNAPLPRAGSLAFLRPHPECSQSQPLPYPPVETARTYPCCLQRLPPTVHPSPPSSSQTRGAEPLPTAIWVLAPPVPALTLPPSPVLTPRPSMLLCPPSVSLPLHHARLAPGLHWALHLLHPPSLFTFIDLGGRGDIDVSHIWMHPLVAYCRCPAGMEPQPWPTRRCSDHLSCLARASSPFFLLIVSLLD